MPLPAIIARRHARNLVLGLALAGAAGLLAAPPSPVSAQSGGSSGGGSSSSGAAGGSAGSGAAAGGPGGGVGSPASGTVAPPAGIGAQSGAIPTVPGGPAPRAPESPAPSPAAGAATLPNGANEMNATGSLRPGDTTGGVAGSRNEGAQRAGQAPACSEVLAHRDYFTANVIAGCERQAKGGQANAAPDTGRAGNSLEGGVKPLDKPSEVQTKKAPSDAKALGSICSNC